ncbi:hypothetical protein Trydic_g21508 [Trypoxylus dichotomus]
MSDDRELAIPIPCPIVESDRGPADGVLEREECAFFRDPSSDDSVEDIRVDIGTVRLATKYVRQMLLKISLEVECFCKGCRAFPSITLLVDFACPAIPHCYVLIVPFQFMRATY